MPSFKKKVYTEPIGCKHSNDVLKDWYIFFRFKYNGKVYKFKRREGINRIKELKEKINALEELCDEISFDLKNGWNPILDPKREKDYSPYLPKQLMGKKLKQKKVEPKKPTKAELRAFFDAGRGGKLKPKF